MAGGVAGCGARPGDDRGTAAYLAALAFTRWGRFFSGLQCEALVSRAAGPQQRGSPTGPTPRGAGPVAFLGYDGGMSEPLTDEEIAELRRLDRAADSAQWVVSRAEKTEVHRDSPAPGGGRGEGVCEVYGWGELRHANALLIAAARNALSRLLDELERWRAEHPDPNDPERQRAAAAAYEADYKPSDRELLPLTRGR